ncbi:MAG: hypothetical protein ABJV68_06845 [Paracoccaceae bacterium]
MNAHSFTDSFNKHADTLRDATAKQELDDFNHATSGADVGRMQKHGMGVGIDPSTGEKKGSAAQRLARTLDWLLLNDAAYAETYEQAFGAVFEAAEKAADLLERLLGERAADTAAVASLEQRAATLPDGRKVFRDEEGAVVDTKGQTIEDDLAAGILWRGDEPTYEEYRAANDRVAALDAAINTLQGIETELGGLQGQLNDKDAPPTADGLDDIQNRADALSDRIDEITVKTQHTMDRKVGFDSSENVQSLDVSAKANVVIPPMNIGG